MSNLSPRGQIEQAVASAATSADGMTPPTSLPVLEPGQPAAVQRSTMEAVAGEAIGIKATSTTLTTAPKAAFWEQAPNLVLLLLLIYLAVGAVCEISSRNEDYARVAAHHKWLVSCLNGSTTDKGCPKDGDLGTQLEVAVTQLRRYDSLNAVGVSNKCLTAPVIAAPMAGFHESCLALASDPPVKVEPERKALLAPILSPSWFSFRAAPLQLDQHPRDQLYFFLVLVASTIGSLIGGLRAAGITTLKDLALGLGAGFAVYLLLRSGSFVSLTAPVNVDILNPFSAAAVGMLVGLFSDKAFKLIDSLFGAVKGRLPEGAEANRVTVEAARVTTGPVAAHSIP